MHVFAAPSGLNIEPVVEETSITTYSVTYIPEEPGKAAQQILHVLAVSVGCMLCVVHEKLTFK